MGETRVVVLGGRGTADQHFPEINLFDTVSQEWLQPALEGDIPPARGSHTATVVGDQLLVFGGSSDFSREIMQCTTFHSTIHALKAVDVTTGKAIPKSVE